MADKTVRVILMAITAQYQAAMAKAAASTAAVGASSKTAQVGAAALSRSLGRSGVASTAAAAAASSGTLAGKLGFASTAASGASSSQTRLKAALSGVSATTMSAASASGAAASKVGLLGRASDAGRVGVGRFAASTAAMSASANAAQSGVGRLSGALTPTGVAALRAGSQMKTAGGSLGAFGAASTATAAGLVAGGGLVAGLYGSAKAAIDFESDFAGVRKTVDGSDATLNGIAMGFRNMATEIPASTSELTAVGEAAGQLGIKTSNILGFSRVMVDLGNTTNLSADQAATSLARLANITGMPQDKFDRLGSTVVALGNNLATTEAEIVDMGLRLAGAGAQVGLTEAEILGLAGALSSLGLPAEAAGTAFTRVMLEIDKAVDSGGDGLRQFSDIAGSSAEEFAAKWRANPTEALIEFVEGLGRLDKAGGNTTAFLEELGLADIRVGDALRRTAGAGDQLRTAIELGSDSWQENTALTKEAATRYETTASRIKVAGNAVKDFAIETGQVLAPAVGAAADAFAALTRGATDVLQGVGGDSGGGFWEEVGLGARNTLRAITGINFGQAAFEKLGWSAGGAADETKGLMSEARAANEHMARAGMAAETAAAGVDEYGDAAAGSAGEVGELTDAQKGLQSALGSFADPMATYNTLLEKKEEKERKAAEATAASTKNASDSWEDYAGDVDVSIGDVITSLRKQIRHQQDWERNLVKIARRGGADIAQALAALGPEGADLVAEFAGATDKEFRQAARLWLKQTNQGGDAVARSLDEKLAKAAGNADKGGKNISDKLTARVTQGRINVGKEMNKIPEIFTREMVQAKIEADRRGRAAADTLSGRIGDGRKNVAKQLNMIPPEMRKQLGLTRSNADKGGKQTADTLTGRVTTGRKDVGKLLNQIPPHMRTSMSNTKDRAKTGADNVGAAMNRELAQRARKWARIVAGYGDSLSAGLNPILRKLKAGTIKSPHDASIRAIERATGELADGGILATRADGGVDMSYADLVGRPQAHMVSRPTVLYGEPETAGEAYIPFAAGKRPRSRQIADETVSRLGGQVQWFAKGGFNKPGDVPKVPSGDGTVLGRTGRAGMRHARSETVDWLKENLVPDVGMAGPGRYKAMFAAVKSQFPTVQLLSGFRPGAITATGNASYHGKGRAIDISPRMDIFDWIRNRYAATELIYSPAGSRQEWHGRPHYYSGITRSMHWDHIHWAMKMGGIISKEVARALTPQLTGAPRQAGADLDLLGGKDKMPFGVYDRGGMLPQGLSMAYNGTGQPEPVGAQSLAGATIVIEVPGLGESFDARIRTVNQADGRRREYRERMSV